MNYQEIKLKIKNCRNILVGIVPSPEAQVQQITIALMYKFMDDMDKEAQEKHNAPPMFFAGEFAKYSWTKLLSPQVGNQERLNLYAEAIEKMNENKGIPQLFRDIFKGAFLPYRNPESLGLFLKEINGFTYDNSENLGNAFEHLLSIMGSQGDAGMFRTPRHIIDFIVDAVNPQKNENICDPACGSAGFLISAYKHIINANTKNKVGDLLSPEEKKKIIKNFVGYDISPDMVRLSKVNMYFHGFLDPTIFEYDTLSSEEKWDESFDVMLANPPFMSPKGGIKPHKRFSVQAKRSEVLFVDYILEHLRPKGRAGIIVPEGIIFQSAGAYKQLRKMLVEDGLMAVVSLPAGVFNPYAGVKTSILLFDNEIAKKTKNILFLKIQNDGYDLGAQRRVIDKNDLPMALEIIKKYKSALKDGKDFKFSEEENKNAHLVVKNKIAETGDYNLSGDRYKETAGLINQKWPMVEIGDICEILNGYAFKSENYVNEGVRVIRITNVQKGVIVDANPKFYPTNTKEPIEKYKLAENDFLISLTGNVGRVGLLPKEFLPAGLNQRVACLRVNENKINKTFLFSILNQDSFEKECINSASGMAQKNMSTVWLAKYKLPLPPLDVQRKIVEQIKSKQQTIDCAKTIIENLESERHHFYQDLKKLDCGQVKLGDYVNFVSGLTLSIPDSISENGTPIISINNITEDGRITLKGIRNISLPNKKSINYLKKGDLLFNWRNGSKHLVGKTGYFDLPGQFVFASFLLGIRTDEKILLPKFLWHLLNSYRASGKYMQFMRQNVNGLFNREELKILEIPLPSIDIQARLVDQMYKENEIINANRKLIEIYEQKIADVLSEI